MVSNLIIFSVCCVLNADFFETIQGIRRGDQYVNEGPSGTEQILFERNKHVINSNNLRYYFETEDEIGVDVIRIISQSFNTSLHIESKAKMETKMASINVMEIFWSMFYLGDLDKNSGRGASTYSNLDFWSSVRFKVLPGSIIEIGGCWTSLRGALDKTQSTVISVVQDHIIFQSCEDSNLFTRSIRNFHLSQVDASDLSTWVNRFSKYPVVFGNLIISNLTNMSRGLLPHEFVNLLIKMFSAAQHIFITNFTTSTDTGSYFNENWPVPSDLVSAVCTAGGLLCEQNQISGIDVWGLRRSIIQIIINHSLRQLDETHCSQFQTVLMCYLEYNIGEPPIIVYPLKDTFNQTVDNNDIALTLFNNEVDISQKTKEILVFKVLNLEDSEAFSDNLVLNGPEIYSGTLWDGNDSQVLLDENAEDKSNIDISNNRRPGILAVRTHLEREGRQTLPNTYSNWNTADTNKFEKTKGPYGQIGDSVEREGNGIESQKIRRFVWVPESHSKSTIDGDSIVRGNLNMQRQGDNPMTGDLDMFKDLTDTIITTEERQVRIGLDDLTKPVYFVTEKLKFIDTKQPTKLTQKFNNRNKFIGAENRSRVRTASRVPVTKKLPQNNFTKTIFLFNTSKPRKTRRIQVVDFNSNRIQRKTVPENTKTKKILFKSHAKHAIKSGIKYDSETLETGVLSALLKSKNQETNLSFTKRNLLSLPPEKRESINTLLTEPKYKSSGNVVSSANTTGMFYKQIKKSVNMINLDQQLYDFYWNTINLHENKIFPRGQGHNNIMVFGRGHHCLLSSKLSLVYPSANILTILPQDENIDTDNCRKLISSLPSHNNFIFYNDMKSTLVNQIYQLPQLFQLQILGMDILANIIQTVQGFAMYLGKLLTNAEMTILELPPFHRLQHALRVLRIFKTTKTRIVLMKGLIHHALQLVKAEYYPVQILNTAPSSGKPSLLLIQLKSFTRKVNIDCKGSESLMKYVSGIGSQSAGINLRYLLTLNLQPTERSILYKYYLHLPIVKDMCPVNILWRNQSLQHINQHISSDNNNLLSKTTDQLKSEMVDNRFLFLDVNNNDEIITSLSKNNPNSTFIAVRGTEQRGNILYNKTVENNLDNIAVTIQTLDETFTNKILHSPDIFRYVFIGYEEFLQTIMRQDRSNFNSVLGNIISTSITTFIQLPSAKILSLAASTFHKGVFLPADDQSVYISDRHPLSKFISAERDMVYQSAKADVDINITSQILPAINNNNAVLPWKLLRIDIKQLIVKVGHHFGFETDGHQRKYIQHVRSFNKSLYDVHLIRQKDGFKIPYGNVNAISMITLFRMGLVESQKNLFYGKFLRLPLYEDMAPWNIVFRQGLLEYIDYDTKNNTYNKLIPSAYRILMVLTNYHRTVSDFGKCGSDARTEYDFHYISKCVGSDFHGHCKDPQYPVPCADKSCRSTYIHCLQALLIMDNTKLDGLNGKEKNYLEEKAADWSFNKDGAISTSG